nr:MAG TPA: hypothetical protein [Caudoviricetes sp.]
MPITFSPSELALNISLISTIWDLYPSRQSLTDHLFRRTFWGGLFRLIGNLFPF